MKLTDEQVKIVEAAKSGEDIKVIAYAGSGKTSTLVEVAKALDAMGKRGIYLAFNNSIAKESKGRFPESTECRTFHSLAYLGTQVFLNWKDRLVFKLPLKTIVNNFSPSKYYVVDPVTNKKIYLSQYFVAYQALKTLEKFMMSLDETMQFHHVPNFSCGSVYFIGGRSNNQILMKIANEAYQIAKRMWLLMLEKNSDFPITHSFYLKAFQLSNPKLNYDYIMVDEAQDSNPLVIDIMEKQTCQKIWVGDTWQQIYDWLGAINSLKKVSGKELRLTQSFRFGDKIAEIASRVIMDMGEEIPVRGLSSIDSKVGDFSFYDNPEHTKAIICRTNQQVILHILMVLAKQDCIEYDYYGCPIIPEVTEKHLENPDFFIVSPGIEETKSLIYDLLNLTDGMMATGPLSSFSSFEEIEQIYEETKDPQLKILLDLNKKYNLSILLKILDTIKFNNSVYQKHLEREEDRKGGKKLKKSKFDIDKPVMSICTMHKSKGLEWDEVQLVYQKPLNLEELKHIYKVSDDDYKKIDDLIHSIEEEKKLIYVAMTRAKKRLKFDSSIARKYLT